MQAGMAGIPASALTGALNLVGTGPDGTLAGLSYLICCIIQEQLGDTAGYELQVTQN